MSWAWSTPLESRLRSPPTGLYGLSDRYADQDMYADHTLINAGTDPGPFQRTATQLHVQFTRQHHNSTTMAHIDAQAER